MALLARAPRTLPAPATPGLEVLPRDAVRAARAARLQYSRLDRPGRGRKNRGKSFAYRDENGRRIQDAKALARVRRVAIPPAWTGGWICPAALGHIQATGRDA